MESLKLETTCIFARLHCFTVKSGPEWPDWVPQDILGGHSIDTVDMGEVIMA